ncbi:MAG TPA: hypothetical protein VJZ02_02300 [Candidatus Brocadiales bacterium]|nr:hypothetical protein [Candidatus Brocadiales bacterium]
MLLGTEVPIGGETVPVKAPATGTMGWWRYEARETEGGKIKTIREGEIIGVIDVEGNSSLPQRVRAPSEGHIDKIIKKEGEPVTEGETIAEWMPVPTVPLPLEILDRYGYSSIG